VRLECRWVAIKTAAKLFCGAYCVKAAALRDSG
jgi:hypothetical protein